MNLINRPLRYFVPLDAFTKLFPDAGIKALSWKEPYASLMLHGKTETRVWDTAYRGWVLICASKQPYKFEAVNNKISGSHQTNRIFVETLGLDNFADNKMYDYSLGNAIAIGYLTNTWEMRPEMKIAALWNIKRLGRKP